MLKFKLCAFCAVIASAFTLFLFGCGDDSGTNPGTPDTGSNECTQWGNWSLTRTATCGFTGDSTRRCQTRGIDSTETIVIDKLTGPQCVPLTYGTLNYGGQTYKTVKIGNLTWMAENLNFETESNSWCYSDSSSYCEKYGRLYTYAAAKSACPSDWRLPANEDWDDLMAAVYTVRGIGTGSARQWRHAGTRLKSETGWDTGDRYIAATNEFGFSALPGGWRGNDRSGGRFSEAELVGGWWGGTGERDTVYASRFSMRSTEDHVTEIRFLMDMGYSVRCVKED